MITRESSRPSPLHEYYTRELRRMGWIRASGNCSWEPYSFRDMAADAFEASVAITREQMNRPSPFLQMLAADDTNDLGPRDFSWEGE